MPVNAGNKLAGHAKGTFLIVHVTTGRTETAFASERDKFKFSTVRATIKSTAVRRVTTVNHFVNVMKNSFSRMELIKDVFIIISKNSLENIFVMHKNILQ